MNVICRERDMDALVAKACVCVLLLTVVIRSKNIFKNYSFTFKAVCAVKTSEHTLEGNSEHAGPARWAALTMVPGEKLVPCTRALSYISAVSFFHPGVLLKVNTDDYKPAGKIFCNRSTES